MKAVAIVLAREPRSEEGFRLLNLSHQQTGQPWPLVRVDAVEPEEVDQHFRGLGIKWTYPWDKPRRDDATGLILTPYKTRNRLARMACFLSHFYLWDRCVTCNAEVMILEDDALFTRQLKGPIEGAHMFGAFSLNDPRGATRKAHDYHAKLQAMPGPVAPAPWVDAPNVPQGLPGNSAYVLHPVLARKLVEFVEVFGAWPNDALMCRQLFPEIGCLTNYATKVSGRPSSLA